MRKGLHRLIHGQLIVLVIEDILHLLGQSLPLRLVRGGSVLQHQRIELRVLALGDIDGGSRIAEIVQRQIIKVAGNRRGAPGRHLKSPGDFQIVDKRGIVIRDNVHVDADALQIRLIGLAHAGPL